MKKINGVTIFNGTPHEVTLMDENGTEYVIPSDGIISARPMECPAEGGPLGVEFVSINFVGTDEGRQLITDAREAGADIIVGSIIAAQAYPGSVVAMVACHGFERVPPAEKRMRADKFTIFSDGDVRTVAEQAFRAGWDGGFNDGWDSHRCQTGAAAGHFEKKLGEYLADL